MELERALALWRETRAAEIAEIVDELSRVALAGWTPPAPRLNHLFHDAWLVAARDVVQRGWAAETVTDKLPARDVDMYNNQQRQNATALAQRLDALRETGPDPRIASAAMRVITGRNSGLAYDHVKDACVHALADSLDDRIVSEIARIRTTSERWACTLFDRALANRPKARALAPDEMQRFTTSRIDDTELWREVAARPDDNDARAVLADVLQTRSDPRGELIALQLADREHARQAALLKHHGVDWLGTLRNGIYRAQFRRGFVAKVELAGRQCLTDDGWAVFIADPALATVEDLILGRGAPEIYARLLVSPAVKALRRIEVFDHGTSRALEATPAKLEHIACTVGAAGTHAMALADVLPACERRSTLVSFGIMAEAFDVLATSQLFGRLQALTLGAGEVGLAKTLALWSRIPRDVTLTIAPSARIEECLTKPVPWIGALRLAPSEHAVIARASGEWMVRDLCKHLDALPKQVKRLEVERVKPDTERQLRAAAAGRELDVAIVPAAPRVGFVTMR